MENCNESHRNLFKIYYSGFVLSIWVELWPLYHESAFFSASKAYNVMSWPWVAAISFYTLISPLPYFVYLTYLCIMILRILFQVLYVSVAIDNIVDALHTQTLRFPKLYTSVFSFKFKWEFKIILCIFCISSCSV